jgi:uncharacterized protein YjgD (DUF1641 family)
LEEAPIEHAEALLESYELLQTMHDRGIFTVLRGALGASDKLVEAAVTAAESPQSIRALRNAIILWKMLGSMNPDMLQCIAVALEETFGKEQNPLVEPPGLFALLGEFREKELRRSMALVNMFLEVLGSQLKLRGGTGREH